MLASGRREGWFWVHKQSAGRVLYCDCRLSSQVHVAWQPVMGLRPAACGCAAGGAGPLCVHMAVESAAAILGCVAPPTPLLQGVRVDCQCGSCAPGSWRVGTEIFKLLASAKMRHDRQQACVMKSAGLGRGLSVVAALAFGFLSCKAHWVTLYGRHLGTTVTPPRGSYWLPLPFSLFPNCLLSVHLSLAGSLGGVGSKGPPGSALRRLRKLVRRTPLPFLARGTLLSWGFLSALTSISPEEGMM